MHRTPVSISISLLALGLAFLATPAHALRIVDYNIHDYPGSSGAARDPYFRTILGPLGPDIVVVQEMQYQTGVNEFLNSVLNTLEPGQWAAAPFFDGYDTNNALFYKPAKVQFLGGWWWYPGNLRLVNCYRLKPVGYASAAAELRIYSVHLKASNQPGDPEQRLTEATGIRDSMNAMPPGTHAILCGDFNIYTSTEPAFQKFLESQADNDGRLYDPLNAVGAWQDNPVFASIHTQSPCSSCPSGFSSGGLDDRFDMFLPTYNMNDGQGLNMVPSTYLSVGNDGQHLNKNITDAPTIPEGATYAGALWNASDHLPIRTDIQVPSKLQAPSSLAMGTVIVGGGADLHIKNTASYPADYLDYTLGTSGLFDTPPGPFSLANSFLGATHTVVATAGAFGPRTGSLTIVSDAPDSPFTLVNLSATVLDHAAASLDSTTALTSQTLDFGAHPVGGFSDQLARVHNRDYDAMHAQLALQDANITGGGGRFSIVGGFSPTLVADVAASYGIHFDDAGAADGPYSATLTFTSTDELIPGAIAQPDLVVTLQAQVSSGAVSAPDAGVPAFTRLLPPFPNPIRDGATIGFDLATAGAVRLEVFDLSGRRVASLANGRFEAGRYSVRWNGRDARGAAASPGLYFVRFAGPGGTTATARLVVGR